VVQPGLGGDRGAPTTARGGFLYSEEWFISAPAAAAAAAPVAVGEKVALSLFRMLVQKEIGYKSEEPGYAGLIDEAQNYMVAQVSRIIFVPFIPLLLVIHDGPSVPQDSKIVCPDAGDTVGQVDWCC